MSKTGRVIVATGVCIVAVVGLCIAHCGSCPGDKAAAVKKAQCSKTATKCPMSRGCALTKDATKCSVANKEKCAKVCAAKCPVDGKEKCAKVCASKCPCPAMKGTCDKAACPALCKGCGQVKGSKTCCDKKAEKCGKCELAKGSPGCAKACAAAARKAAGTCSSRNAKCKK